MQCGDSKNRVAWLCQRDDGAVAIEFAIIAPVLLFFIFGIIEFSLLMYASTVLEGATTISSRLGKTGFEDVAGTGLSRQQMIEQLAKDKSDGLLNPDLITITTLAYGGLDDIGVPEPFTDQNGNALYDAGEPYTDINGNAQWDADMGAAGLGGANDIVVYTVRYPWRISTPMIARFFDDGVLEITSSAVVKNEPYDINLLGGAP